MAAVAWAGYAGQMMMLSFDGPAVRPLLPHRQRHTRLFRPRLAVWLIVAVHHALASTCELFRVPLVQILTEEATK